MFRVRFLTLHHLLSQCFLATSWTFKKPSRKNSLKFSSQLPDSFTGPSRFVLFGMWLIATINCLEEDIVILFSNRCEDTLKGMNCIGVTLKDPWILNREAIPPSDGSWMEVLVSFGFWKKKKSKIGI